MTPTTAAVRAEPRLNRLDLAMLGVVVTLGLLNFAQPFSWNQSLFAMSAQKLAEGGVLYRDVWDTRQPGIHMFYTLATRLFGSSEAGIHGLELLWMLAFSAALQRSLAGRVRRRWTASVSPLFVTGFYYAVAQGQHMTQIESLIGFPLYCALWFAGRTDAAGLPRRGALFLSGVAGFAVLFLKLAYAPILLAVWIAALGPALGDPGRLRRSLPALGALAAGLFVPLAAAAVALPIQGVFGAYVVATMDYPARVISNLERFRLPALTDAWRWFVGRWSPLLGFGVVGAVTCWSRGRDPLVPGLVAWFACGILLLLVQITSSWQYQFLLLAPPIGVLAALGIDSFADSGLRLPGRSGRGTAWTLAACAALLFSWPIGVAALKALHLARDQFALTEAGRIRFTNHMSQREEYARYREDVEYVRAAAARPGPIFVVGSPIVNWLAERPGILPRDGGNLVEHRTAAEWAAEVEAMRQGPPAYIYLEKKYDEMMIEDPARWGPFIEYLERDWALRYTGIKGSWYAPRNGMAAR
jgi:hypothetical protein